MSRPLALIVTDTSPLITLALAEELDLLLRPGLALAIPDAVYIEATRVRGAPGATVIIEWLNKHRGRAAIVPTEIGLDQIRRLEERRSIRGLGEAAAIEVIDRYLADAPESAVALLFEDTDVVRRRALIDARAIVMSTGDFLHQLEDAGLIQSSDHVLDKAAAAGRNVDRQRERGFDEEAGRALAAHLRDRRGF